MNETEERAALAGGLVLLERAVNYTLVSLHTVTPAALSDPTPCRDWDLRTLLAHLADSLGALHEALDTGHVDLDPDRADRVAGTADPVGSVRRRASRVIGACTNAGTAHRLISIAGTPMTAALVTGTGAIEVAVHGWDIAQACGQPRPLPPSLAEQMLELSPLFVTDDDRPAHFADPVEVPATSSPGSRLVAFLGRYPDRSVRSSLLPHR